MSTENSKRKRAITLLIITSFFWSSGGVLIKNVHLNPLAISAGRSLIAALVIWLFVDKPLNFKSKDKLLGAFFYAMTVILFVIANKYTTAANAILLQYTAPIYIIIFGNAFLGERSYLYDYITIAAVIVGMIIFFLDSLNGGGTLGNVIAVLSGVAFAFTAIFMRKQKDYNPLESVFWGNILTGIICSFGFFLEPVKDGQSLLLLVILGVFQLGIPYILYSKAVKNVTALEVTLIPIIEPLLNPVWVFIFNNEAPTVLPLIGGGIVLISITVRTLYVLKRGNE